MSTSQIRFSTKVSDHYVPNRVLDNDLVYSISSENIPKKKLRGLKDFTINTPGHFIFKNAELISFPFDQKTEDDMRELFGMEPLAMRQLILHNTYFIDRQAEMMKVFYEKAINSSRTDIDDAVLKTISKPYKNLCKKLPIEAVVKMQNLPPFVYELIAESSEADIINLMKGLRNHSKSSEAFDSATSGQGNDI